MADTTLPALLDTGTHAARPAASAVGTGALYSCTDHNLIYQTDGASWTTWATLGSAASGSITASGYTQSTARLLGRTTASSGAIEEITVGSGLSLSAGSLTASGSSGAMELITDTVLGSDTANFDFTSIPGTYKHLVIHASLRTDRASNADDPVRIRFNNDSGSNYDGFFVQFFSGYTNAAVNEDLAASSIPRILYATAATAVASDFGTGTITILNYAATANLKSCFADGWVRLGTSSTNPRRYSAGGTWRSTSAITRITLLPLNGSNFKTGSRVSLYGIS